MSARFQHGLDHRIRGVDEAVGAKLRPLWQEQEATFGHWDCIMSAGVNGTLTEFYAKVCTITGPATAVAGPVSRGVRFCSIHASPRLLDSSAPA
jgi:hypothetical protein